MFALLTFSCDLNIVSKILSKIIKTITILIFSEKFSKNIASCEMRMHNQLDIINQVHRIKCNVIFVSDRVANK